MYYSYILQSIEDPEYHYKGHCENLEERLKQHNSGATKSNKHKAPFIIVYFEQSDTKEGAIKIEKYWKTAAGRRYLHKKIRMVT